MNVDSIGIAGRLVAWTGNRAGHLPLTLHQLRNTICDEDSNWEAQDMSQMGVAEG